MSSPANICQTNSCSATEQCAPSYLLERFRFVFGRYMLSTQSNPSTVLHTFWLCWYRNWKVFRTNTKSTTNAKPADMTLLLCCPIDFVQRLVRPSYTALSEWKACKSRSCSWYAMTCMCSDFFFLFPPFRMSFSIWHCWHWLWFYLLVLFIIPPTTAKLIFNWN